MDDRRETEQELGQEKVSRLLVRYSLPAIVAMTVSSLYNIVDRIFIGQGVGPYAIAGLALTLPIMNLAIAFGSLVGAGASALTSIRLGEDRADEAGRILGNTLVLEIALGTIFSATMLVFLSPILRLFGASPQTLPYASGFMRIILLGNPIQCTYMGLNNIMRSSGHPRKAMATTLSTVGVNVVLAPVFIFWFHWGIRGAALATVCSQVVGFSIVLAHFSGRRKSLRLGRDCLSVDLGIVRGIFAIGMSSFFIQVGASLVAVVMNRQLVRHGGDFAVGAFGIVNGVLMLAVMTVLGIAQGMQPIAGFNYGARRYGRVMRVLRHAIAGASLVTCSVFLVAELLPGPVASAFTRDPKLSAAAARGLRLVFLVFPLVGFQIATSNFFQSIGRAKLSILLTLSRQVGFLIPFLFLLPPFLGLTGVWISLPASDLAATILTVLILRHERKRIRGLDAFEVA